MKAIDEYFLMVVFILFLNRVRVFANYMFLWTKRPQQWMAVEPPHTPPPLPHHFPSIVTRLRGNERLTRSSNVVVDWLTPDNKNQTWRHNMTSQHDVTIWRHNITAQHDVTTWRRNIVSSFNSFVPSRWPVRSWAFRRSQMAYFAALGPRFSRHPVFPIYTRSSNRSRLSSFTISAGRALGTRDSTNTLRTFLASFSWKSRLSLAAIHSCIWGTKK